MPYRHAVLWYSKVTWRNLIDVLEKYTTDILLGTSIRVASKPFLWRKLATNCTVYIKRKAPGKEVGEQESSRYEKREARERETRE